MILELFHKRIGKEIILNNNAFSYAYSIEYLYSPNLDLWFLTDYDGRLLRISKFPNTPILVRRIDGKTSLHKEGINFLQKEGFIQNIDLSIKLDIFFDENLNQIIVDMFYDLISNLFKEPNTDIKIIKSPRSIGKFTPEFEEMIKVISNYSYDKLKTEEFQINELFSKRNIIPKSIETENAIFLDFRMGCPRNKTTQCKFCYYNFGRGEKMMTQSERLKHIEKVASFFKKSAKIVRQVFPLDGDFPLYNLNDMEEMLSLINNRFPSASITCFGYARTILNKERAYFEELAAHNVVEIINGVESGCDDMLLDMRKGVTSEEIVKAAEIVKEAGINFSAVIQVGLPVNRTFFKKSPEEYISLRAKRTAALLNRILPTNIFISKFELKKITPYYKEKDNYYFLFEEQAEAERKIFIDSLCSKNQLILGKY